MRPQERHRHNGAAAPASRARKNDTRLRLFLPLDTAHARVYPPIVDKSDVLSKPHAKNGETYELTLTAPKARSEKYRVTVHADIHLSKIAVGGKVRRGPTSR